MDLSEVGVSCRACRERDLLPITCDVCCWSYCRAHSAPADHQCVAEPADVLSIDQSHDACRRLATLMTRTVIPNAKANADTKFRTLSLHSKALAFLPDVRGGLALLQSFGWSRVGDFLTLGVAQPGEDVLDWRKSLDRQERHFTQLLRQLGEKAPGSSKRVKQDFEFFLVLDFEATCQDGPEKIKPQEIIECKCKWLGVRGLQHADLTLPCSASGACGRGHAACCGRIPFVHSTGRTSQTHALLHLLDWNRASNGGRCADSGRCLCVA